MKKYTFKCTCGDVISVDAMTMEEAQTKFAEIMTEDAAKAHFVEKHPGQEMPPYAELMAGVVLTEEMETPVQTA